MRRLLLGFITVCTVVPPAGIARAEIERIVIRDSGTLGTFAGREYTWVAAEMEGAVARDDGSLGHYRVPISLMYPDKNPNGFGFVDVVSNADFQNFFEEAAPLGRRSVGYSGDVILSDFLRTEGFTYIAVQWSRMTTEILGPEYGTIENGADGYEILKDAVRLLRTPIDLDGAPGGGPAPVRWVIGHGQSGSASVLRGLVWAGENRHDDGSLNFDGFFLTGNAGDSCRILNNDDTLQDDSGEPAVPLFYSSVSCPEPLADHGKSILLRTQSEIEREDEGLPRFELSDHRVYELAGVSHIPTFMRNLKTIGAERQNPVSWRPVAKAMLRHLAAWIAEGREPPPPVYLETIRRVDGTVVVATDDDGNALGGLRLPHMRSVLPNGEPAGAPLGVYGGVDLTLQPEDGYGYARLGGTFEPFLMPELERRYPTRAGYVDLVRRAAATLVADGYILAEDADAYVRAAEYQPLGAPGP